MITIVDTQNWYELVKSYLLARLYLCSEVKNTENYYYSLLRETVKNGKIQTRYGITPFDPLIVESAKKRVAVAYTLIHTNFDSFYSYTHFYGWLIKNITSKDVALFYNLNPVLKPKEMIPVKNGCPQLETFFHYLLNPQTQLKCRWYETRTNYVIDVIETNPTVEKTLSFRLPQNLIEYAELVTYNTPFKT